MATHDQWDTDTGLKLLSSAGIESLPDGWTVRQLGSMLAEERGVAVGVMYPGEHTTGGIPLIRAGELTGSVINDRPEYLISPDVHHEYRRTALEGGELLITLVGEVGLCAVVPNSMRGWNAARAVAVVRLANPSDAPFVRLCLISPPIRHLMHVWCNTTVQATLNLKDLRLLPIPWPPEADRSAIVRAVGSLDDKIEANRRTGRALEGLARGVFKAWFVDFEPVKAKAAGATAFPGMPPETFATLPTRLIDSELGPVPQEWTVSNIGAVAQRIAMGPFGSDIKTDNFVSDGVPVIRGGNLTNGFVDRNFVYLTETKADQLANANAFPGDIVITHRGTLGQIGLIPTKARYRRYVVSQSQMLVRPDPATLPAHFLYLFLISAAGQHELLANKTQTGVPAISRPTTSLKAIPLVVPDRSVVDAFECLVSTLFDARVAADAESAKLAALRDYLLPRLLSGLVRMGNAEKAIT